jgi:SET domain-containing protein
MLAFYGYSFAKQLTTPYVCLYNLLCPISSFQVFLTPGKKGWGLRSAERLPCGAFVCEYIGEILTNTELYERNTELYGKNNKKGNTRHTYPVLLDADWGTEHVLKDDEALCLDGTFYGNVARFINHR